jgi:hypothetical protein
MMFVLALAAYAPACTGDTEPLDVDAAPVEEVGPAEETSAPIDSTIEETSATDSGSAVDSAVAETVAETSIADSAPSDVATDTRPADSTPADTLLPDVGLCTALACTTNAQCKPACGNCSSGFCTPP